MTSAVNCRPLNGSFLLRAKPRPFSSGPPLLPDPSRPASLATEPGGGPAGGDRLLGPAGGSRPLDAGVAGRRDGAVDRARARLTRDGAAAPGRERAQALAPEDVVRPAGQWRVRRPHGGRARPLRGRARPQASGGVLRREPDAADRRGAPADPGGTGPGGAVRLRVSP